MDPDCAVRACSTVLVVDDDISIREMLAVILEMDGYAVFQAEDGESALEVLAAEDVDLVTLDVMMPGMDGWEVADRMQDDPRTRSIPRVMISGKPLDELMRACGAKQAAAVLTKPFDFVGLSELIGRLLVEHPVVPAPRNWQGSSETAEAPRESAGLQES